MSKQIIETNYPLPRTNVILGYKDLFNEEPPEDRIALVRHISKDVIIAELAGLNYRLTGRMAKEIDTNFETQTRELLYFSGGIIALNDKYAELLNKVAQGRKSFVFTRQGCLFGIEEIIHSDIPIVESFKMGPVNTWEALIKYILCVNTEITHVEESKPGEPINFETLSPKLLPISELMLVNDPFYVVHKGLLLMEYLAAHQDIGPMLYTYFEDIYQLPYDHFIFELHRMWMANKNAETHLDFYYILRDNDQFKRLFDTLSQEFKSDQFFKLLNIRKNPFYKREENHYLLIDQNILLEKAYYQFINDFWFDKVKATKKTGGGSVTMQDYKSVIGYFFENYVEDKINYSFSNAPKYQIKTFDELKYDNGGKELGDVYIRHHEKVVLAEVKSTSLYDNERYGGNVDALYKNNRNKFFETYGVDQLANNIKNLDQNIMGIDDGLIQRKKIKLWPVIIFNEKAFQTPVMAQVFNVRFQELMTDFNSKKYTIFPLTLMHISDLETMESELNTDPNKLWSLLQSNYNPKLPFIPPFYITLNRNNIKANYGRIREKVIPLFDKYGPEKSEQEK